MKFTKLKLVLPTVIVFTFLSARSAAAFWPFTNNSTTTTSSTTTPTLLEKVIEKFGLNKDQVDQVVTDYRAERQNQMKAVFEQRLDQAITEGKITEDQKQLILNKHQELQTQWTAEQQQREQRRDELENWATQNGIDLEFLQFGFGRGGHGMMRGDGWGMVRGQ